MTILQALFLAFVQGVTEFLPVSSSGHLVLFQKLFRTSEPPVLFDILLHLGTLGAIVIFFRREIISLIREWRSQLKLWSFLIIGSIPAALFGLFLNSRIKEIFNSLTLVGVMWTTFGLLLLFTRLVKAGKKTIEKKKPGLTDALVVGLFQAAALFPGISRSGATIVAGKTRKLSSETAFLLSFLLAIPAILGATLLGLKDIGGQLDLVSGIIAVFASGGIGYFSLRLLQRTLKSDHFYLFGFYCLAVGFLSLFLSLKF